MESVSRISSLLETARDLTLDAARDVGPRKNGRAAAMPAQQIKKLLDGRNERDVLDGLRRVIAMQFAQPPQPTLSFFPAVLKTLSHPYPSTRPLVYSYLLHHAEADPDTALLAVNTIQKSLADANPRVRAMALKTMSDIRVPVLSQIISLAIKRGASDLSPLVRKAAALACIKCVRLDSGTQPQVEEYLASLLGDKQYYVAGAAVQAFMEVCPARLDLIHPIYRRICKMIVDMDEWGQLALLKLMTSYARQCFPRRYRSIRREPPTQEDKSREFYEELDPEESQKFDEVDVLDPDLELFLEAVRPLLQSRNSAVILSVTKAYLYLSPTVYLPHSIGPLMALLRSPQDIQYIAFYNIVQIALLHPLLFVPFTRHFFLRTTETPPIRRLKMEVLTLTFPQSEKQMQDLILAELEYFSHGDDAEVVRDSVRAIGRCAQNSSANTARRCLTLLLRQIHSPDVNLVGEAIDVVRHLIQRNPLEHRKTIVRLAKNLDTLTSPTARASVVWLVGEFAASEADGIAADVLRLLIRGYADEDDDVKAQIILLAAKVYLHYLNAENEKLAALKALDSSATDQPQQDPRDDASIAHEGQEPDTNPVPLLFAHVLLLARYTPSYDLRDRARTYRALLSRGTSDKSNTDLATLLLLAPKPIPLAPSPGETRQSFGLGTASLVVGENTGSSSAGGIPDWVAEGDEPDPRLRDVGTDEVTGTSAIAASAGRKLDEALTSSQASGGESTSIARTKTGMKDKTLDDWLDEESSSEEEESEEESESGEEDSEEGSEEYESESGEEDDDEEEEEEDEADEKARLVH